MVKSDDKEVYYKGTLVWLNDNEKISDRRVLGEYDYIHKKIILQNMASLNEEEIENLRIYLLCLFNSCSVTRKDIIKIFDKLFEKDKTLENLNYESIEIPIIFKIKGNYAEEVHTGIMFPIITKSNLDFKYEIQINDSIKAKKSEYQVQARPMLNVPNLERVKVAIMNFETATKEEVNHYYSMFGYFKPISKKRKYRAKLEILAKKNGNVIKSENYDINKSKISDKDSLLIKQIEFKLVEINKRNPNLYLELEKEFESLKQDDLEDGKVNFLNTLEVILTFNLPYKKDILGYIEMVKASYLLNINNLDFNKFNFYYIEAMADLLYKQQSSYSAMEIRTAEIALGFIYLLEVYKNRELISDIWILENSYFKNLLPNIVLSMMVLKNEKIITLSDDISLDDELTVYKVFNYIKNMNINGERLELMK